MMGLLRYLTSIVDELGDGGWMVQAVGPSDEHPQFHYTIGLFPTAGFELITFGLPLETGITVLNDLAERVRRETRFTHGQTLTDVLADDFTVTLLDVSATGGWALIAELIYAADGTPLRAWQMV